MTATVFRLFLAVLLFAPLAFGTVEPWSLAVMETGMLFCLSLFLLQPLPAKGVLYNVPGLLPLLLFLGYIALQLLPLPAGVIRVLAPSLYDLHAETVGVLDSSAWMTLSINPKATLIQLCRFLAYGACYILTVQLLADSKRLRQTVWLIIGFAACLAVYAILQNILSPNKIYWFRHVPYAWSVGPYIYHNHFAGFMEMLVPLALALFYHYRPRVSYKKSWRRRLYELFSQYRTNLYILLGFAVLLMMTSIFISISRGGIISVALASMLLLTLLRRRRKERGIFFVPILGLFLVLAVGWFGWDAIFARFTEMRNIQGELSNSRFIIWHDSWEIIRRFPWTGTGFGTFGDIYPAVRTFPGHLVVDHAHNDYLELLANGGIVGLGLMGWFLVSVLLRSIGVYGQRREPYSIALFLGVVCGMLALLVHAITDFNFYNGANTLFFFLLLGLTVSAAHTRMRNGLASQLPQVQVRNQTLLGVLVAVCLLITALFNIGILTGKQRFAAIDKTFINHATPKYELQKIQGAALAAVRWDPLEARYWFALANVDNLLGNIKAARASFLKALRYNPVNGEYLQGAGLFMAGRVASEAGDALMRAGIRYDPTNPDRFARYGAWLFTRGQREQGLENLRQAMGLAPGRTNGYISLMLLHGLTDQELLRAMPDNGQACLVIATYLRAVDHEEMVDSVYDHILGFLEHDPAPQPNVFYVIYRDYLRQGRLEEAMAVINQAGELIPDNVGIRLTLARLYEKSNIRYRAIEEYEKALVIDPLNREARERLDKLQGG